MHTWVMGVVLGLLVVVAHGPSTETSLQRCLDACAGAGSETDQATCRLQCREKKEAKDAPDVVRWHTVELKGGSPDSNVQGGKTTTKTVVTPRGTTTTTETDGRDPQPPTAVATTDPSSTGASRTYSVCQLMCDGQAQLGPRTNCRARCALHERQRKVSIGSDRGSQRASTEAPVASERGRDASCKHRCVEQAEQCRARCSGKGSNKATCELQCDQRIGACERRR